MVMLFLCADCSLNCRDPTAEELKCMTDAAANGNAGSDLAANCQGVDFDALKDKKVAMHKGYCTQLAMSNSLCLLS